MEKILGLDLGTNSIGWALRDTSVADNQIVAKGVLTFDKGVGEVKGIEIPLVQARTEARSKRRNYQAEKYRKWELLNFLIENKMCPLTIEELDEWKTYKKGVGRKYPQSEKFIQWLRFDFDGDGKPDFGLFGYDKHESYYLFRMLVISNDEQHKEIFRANPHILGRVLYQLVQRRGYRGRNDDEEEAKTILKGSEKNKTAGVEAIVPYIEEYGTLGAALYYLQKEKNERIRKRYNLRTDYEQELKEICRIQNLSDESFKRLYKAIIWQRPLRSQKGLVGVCTFEKNKSRCPVSHPDYEEFRTWVFINNLKIKLPENINRERESFLKEKIYPVFYKKDKDFKLSSIIKELRKVGGGIESKFKYTDEQTIKKREKEQNDTKVISCTLQNSFKNLFGEDWRNFKKQANEIKKIYKKDGSILTHNISYTIEDIWHILFTFDSKEKLKEFAIKKLEFDEDKATDFSKIKLQQGYATLSISAIKKILPYLRQGFIYSEAIYLANLHKVLGEHEISFETAKNYSSIIRDVISENKMEKLLVNVVNNLISDQLNSEFRFGMDTNYQLDGDDKKDIQAKLVSAFGIDSWAKEPQAIRDGAYSFVEKNYLTFLQKPITAKKESLFLKPSRLHDKIFQHLQATYHMPDENKKYLWHPSEQETYPNPKEKNGIKVLGDPRPISNGFKNPMALRTLHELKKLINYLLQTEQIDEDTRIVIEIARELNDANMRKAIERWQATKRNQNEEYRKKIEDVIVECGLNVSVISKDMIDKYRLWIEQDHQCVYTGDVINYCDMFNGVKYDFEHTIPASMSFDNELKNLTLADSWYNREVKGNKIPYELPNYEEDKIINGRLCKAIKPRLEIIEKKVDDLKNKVENQKIYAKIASTKEKKDEAIVWKHYFRMELDYWRRKLETFTDKEYKAGWRNSQLRDTQTVTKYALPYLKTIFKKTDVQKGSITAAFREIYKIQPRLEKKERVLHSHHAIDAATLTLIPSAAIRDRILLRYNEEKDKSPNNTYHETPRNWAGFNFNHIQSITNDVINNFQAQYRILNDTYKNVRKRGQQQFVKYKDENGKWHYKKDENGKQIRLIAQGDTIRGQLHKESFFGAIKLPETEEKNGKIIPKTDGNGNFVFQINDKRKDNIFIVKREEDLTSFSRLEDFEIIIDPNLRHYFKTEIGQRINQGKSFSEAMADPIWAFGKSEDKNGNPIKPIRHIRCKVRGGGGGYVNKPAIIKSINSYISKRDYKRNIYALNGETAVCAFYQGIINNELIRIIELYSILDIAKTNNGNNIDNIVSPNYEMIIKKEKHLIPLYTTLKINQKVIFYEENADELHLFDKKQLSTRLYFIVKFEEGKISLKHHLNAMAEDALKKEMKKLNLPDSGASAFNFSNSIPKLRLSKSNFNFAIEGKHFEIKPDGEIKWKNG